MRLVISGVLGVEHAELDIRDGACVLVAARNATGKTSIARAAMAVAAGEGNPAGLPATRYADYGHAGGEGTATLDTGDGPHWTWVAHRGAIEGPTTLPISRPEAVGLVDWTLAGSRGARLEGLQAALLPPPDEVLDALRAELAAREMPAERLDGVVEYVRRLGWRDAETQYRERCRDAKRTWAVVTGTGYGGKKAADWWPPGWRPDWDDLTEADAESALEAARDASTSLQRVAAVTEAELDAAEVAREALPGLEDALAKSQAAAREARAKNGAAQSEIRRLDGEADVARRKSQEAVDAVVARPCPVCRAPLVTGRHGGLMVVDLDKAESAGGKAGQRVDTLAKSLKAARATGRLTEPAMTAATQAEGAAKQALETARTAAAVEGKVDDGKREAAVSTAEAAVTTAREAVESVRRRDAATNAQASVLAYGRIATALGASGVRARMLDAGLARLNAGLASLASVTGWGLVEVADTGEVTYAGRAVALCSESERWRAQACVQLTLAALTGSRLVVLDRADLLDGANRERLFGGAVQAALGRPGASDRPMAILACETVTADSDAIAVTELYAPPGAPA